MSISSQLRLGVRFVLPALSAGMLPSVGYAADAPQDTVSIRNTATATYKSGGAAPSVKSNTVEQDYDQLIDVTVKSLTAEPVAASSRLTTLPFRVTNTGNFGSPFRLSVDQLSNRDRKDILVDSIYLDRDGNEQFDSAADIQLPETGITPDIPAGGNVTVFVQAALSPETLDGDTVQFRLNAASALGTGNTGSVLAAPSNGLVRRRLVLGNSRGLGADIASVIAQIAQVKLAKSQTVADPYGGRTMVPGTIITYAVRAQVTGSGTAEGLEVADAIPAGTAYVAGSLRVNGTPLTDATDADRGAANNSGVSVALGDVKGGASDITVAFQVRVTGVSGE